MALGEGSAQELSRAALALQSDLTTKYVREQEWYRDVAMREKLDSGLLKLACWSDANSQVNVVPDRGMW